MNLIKAIKEKLATHHDGSCGCSGHSRAHAETSPAKITKDMIVREVADLVRRAKEAGKRLATLAVDTEVRFRSATDRAAFTNELTEAITKLVAKYHDESAPGGRAHRLVVVAHPLLQKSESALSPLRGEDQRLP